MLAAATGLFVASTSATAGPLWEFTSAGNSFTNGNWIFATSFQVGNSDLTATGLGYYADPNSGRVDANQVALFHCANSDCTTTASIIASVTVDNTYPLTGHFRYVTIAPITLLAGESYQVAGVSQGNNYTWNDPGFFADSGISLIPLSGQVGRWEATAGTTPAFLNYGQSDLGSEDGYWGPNVFVGQPTFTQVPEPPTTALIGVAMLGAVGVSRRKRRS